MTGLAKFVLGLVYAAGIVLMLVFGGGEHDWTRQMEPSINVGQITGAKDSKFSPCWS